MVNAVYVSYVVDGELFALVDLHPENETVLLHSKDFDGEDEEIQLEKVDCSLPCSWLGSPWCQRFMCPMRL